MEILKHQIRAIKIYKKIQKTKGDFFDMLEKQGLIKKLENKYWQILNKEKLDEKTIAVLKKLLADKKNDNLDKKAKHINKEIIIDILSLVDIGSQNNSKKTSIILTKNGDLRLGDLRYSMQKEAKRLKIIQLLDNDYLETDAIRKKTKSINNQAVRKAIGTINQKAKQRLKIKHPLIESKPNSGYHINDLYLLIKE